MRARSFHCLVELMANWDLGRSDVAKYDGLAREIEEHLLPLAETDGLEIVDVEVHGGGRQQVRIFIDRPDGATIGDCQAFSRRVGDEIERLELIGGGYDLEVSTPGLDRVLKKERDFVRYRGRLIKVTTYGPVDGERRFVGELLDADQNFLYLARQDGERVEIPRRLVAQARLHVEL